MIKSMKTLKMFLLYMLKIIVKVSLEEVSFQDQLSVVLKSIMGILRSSETWHPGHPLIIISLWEFVSVLFLGVASFNYQLDTTQNQLGRLSVRGLESVFEQVHEGLS